jgi:hypothetical protein
MEWDENARYQNVWYTAKVVLRVKFISLNACIIREEILNQ